MREIKFRAWDGDRIQKVLTLGLHEGFVSTNKLNSDIDDFVIMQYTGITDKNGKEIYDGDIVKGDLGDLYGDKYNIFGVVVYVDENASHGILPVKYYGKSNNQSCLIIKPDLEVVGNIYENPELLETK